MRRNIEVGIHHLSPFSSAFRLCVLGVFWSHFHIQQNNLDHDISCAKSMLRNPLIADPISGVSLEILYIT